MHALPEALSLRPSPRKGSTTLSRSIPLSVLDLAPIPSGSTASEALRRTVELARLADRLGYVRYWFAEHHNLPSIGSSTPEVLIAHAAAQTERIRFGSGGVMLPNHVPLKVAETYHTLEALHPGRIDLGIGRAPGTDQVTVRALRSFDPEQFPAHLAELVALSRETLPPEHPFASVHVIPGGVTLPPIWILGSTGASARFAGASGLGYAFASHFSPTPAAPAFRAYRESFEPSDTFPRPHAILGVAAVCAETDERADYLALSADLSWARLLSGKLAPFPSPEEALAYTYTPQEQAAVRERRALLIVGNPEKVRARIEQMVAETEANEVMVTSLIHSHAERLRSYELLAEVFDRYRAVPEPALP
jgi:luciferase family oxidoreductase group 1